MKNSSWIRKPLVENITVDFVDGRRKFLEENEKVNISSEAIYITSYCGGKEIVEIFPAISILSISIEKKE